VSLHAVILFAEEAVMSVVVEARRLPNEEIRVDLLTMRVCASLPASVKTSVVLTGVTIAVALLLLLLLLVLPMLHPMLSLYSLALTVLVIVLQRIG